jgi:hypothetical protein
MKTYTYLVGVVIWLSAGSLTCLAQQNSSPLLRFQRSAAYLETESSAPHAQGMWGVTFGSPGDVSHYPNALSCVVIYGDGRYVLERTDEKSVGRPKSKRSEGILTPEEMQELKSILEAESFKTIKTQPMPPMPDYAVTVREIESINTEVNRETSVQQISITKERLKTNRMSGLDEWLNNTGQNEKLLSPLTKWLKDAEKKMKSGLKEATPQYCRPISIG